MTDYEHPADEGRDHATDDRPPHAHRRRTARSRPMREPVFTETMQIAIVVRDLEAAMRTYVHDYGIGPWETYEFNPGNVKDLREYGQSIER